MNPDLSKFSSDISEYRNFEKYSYSYNSVGNLFIQSPSEEFNQNFLNFSLRQVSYDSEKMKSVISTEFIEFSIGEKTPEKSVDDLQRVIDELTLKLASTTPSVTSEQVTEIKSENLALRDIIISLRIKLGEGKDAADFSDTFPFLSKILR